MVCDYGCGQVGLFTKQNGKLCCSKSQNSCPSVRKKNSITKQSLTDAAKYNISIKQIRSRLSNLGQSVESMTDEECLNFLSIHQKDWFARLPQWKQEQESERRSKSNIATWANEDTRNKRVVGISKSYEKYDKHQRRDRQIKIIRSRLNDYISDDSELIKKFSIFQHNNWVLLPDDEKNRRNEQLRIGKEGYQSSPNFFTKHSAAMTQAWNNQTDEQREKRFHKTMTNGFNKKPFKFSSGKIIYVQGYENFALELLLSSHSEEDIVAGSDLNLYIEYDFLNRKRLYYPDIFIPSANKIIEVKSKYYYDKDLDKNKAKADACYKYGYTFEFWVKDKKDFIKILWGNDVKS